ncbi:hypothetical protein FD723_15555 [Nostoc sp. C052]|uniref:hypothetical protein n=1 Tax=Nostoc sp. C052 TaxID=2576902 RepID=UPI0015C2F8A6|nr:hypothetical protein [Nostoc sp. C052]QLE41692.1 hypothetical protein FD723_15555 [Nostoc sp. C052]
MVERVALSTQFTMEILLTIALFITFFLLLRQEKALGKYAQSTTLFTRAVDQYQEAVEGYQEAIADYQEAIELFKQEIEEYELLLQQHGIDKSKLKAEATQQLTPPPPPQFNLHRQSQSKTPQTQLSPILPKDMSLPDLKTAKRQPSKPKAVSKNGPLYKEFLHLLNGNEETANRLITRQQQLNPDRLDNWILEKVIGDLKRDRRA